MRRVRGELLRAAVERDEIVADPTPRLTSWAES